ncbi:Protein of unknown function (DUF3795) [Thermoplasmatales archaeon SCGC AB-539-C06]|nr:Protein of unknown function (DUF3795) [Thermoplasmatales archaeon SCGC AB-539-C06]
MEQISFCGMICNECTAFLATQKNDDDERKKVAEIWSKQYNADIKAENINCDGCLSEGKRFFFHCNVCEVRKCGRERNLKNCAYCNEYACEKLSPIFEVASNNKNTLDQIRKNFQLSK